MPFTARWYNDEKTIIYVEVVGKLTVDDMYSMTEQYNAMFDGVGHTVHVLQDWRRCEGLPPNVLTHARNLLFKKIHRNMGAMVHIGMRLELKIFWGAFERAIRVLIKTPRYLSADTPEKAYELLTEPVQNERGVL
jgi:hypothetical protein